MLEQVFLHFFKKKIGMGPPCIKSISPLKHAWATSGMLINQDWQW